MKNDELRQKIKDLPDKAGVYFFKDSSESVIYVGKAKNLKKRVKNHFQKPDQHAFDFIPQITGIDHIRTDSEKEALLLEQQFIKKYQPRWNVEWKDDKNYFYVAMSADDFPRISLTHQPFLKGSDPFKTERVGPFQSCFGPFVSGREVKSFLKEIRKILSYRSCRNLPEKPCFYASLGLCAAPCIHKKQKKAYSQMIATFRVLTQIYQGNSFCEGLTFAAKVRPSQRIEGYDISNLSGTLAVGSMVVFQNGKADKNSYRKFKIKTIDGQNDVASLGEVLTRRLSHPEWAKPDLIILDGGKGQLKATSKIGIPVVALAKIGKNDGKIFSRYSKKYARLSKLPPNLSNLFLQIRDEAHRFAIAYNRQRRQQAL